jgi:nitrous oxidase accessory protein NosD
MPSIILATKLVWVSILVALAPKADAATLNVPDAVHPTIQAAIAAASTGDTIMVGDGTYNENLLIDKQLTLLSANGRDSTTIVGISNGSQLGTIEIDPNVNGVKIGSLGRGFTIVGIDNGAPGIENAAIYFQGDHVGATIQGNEIEAAGDHGFLTENGAKISDFLIDSNKFTGQTFLGPNPAGNGFGDQFSLANVPRQLVVMGGGPNGVNTANVTFTNNEILGTAGGKNVANQEQGNTLVTIDSDNAIIQNNTFAGTTSRFATQLRARRPGTSITGNVFDSGNC